MLIPPKPANEAQRLAALRKLSALDTPVEERFDRITRLAVALFRVPIAVISLVDEDREWYKSCQGIFTKEGPREVSFCGHAILSDETMVVADTQRDPRFADNPQVTGEMKIRFYAGHALHGPNGSRVGTLCIKDRRSRELDPEELQALRDLAALAEQELNLLTFRQADAELRSAEEATPTEKEALARLTNLMVGREERIVELKKDVNALLAELGRPKKHNVT